MDLLSINWDKIKKEAVRLSDFAVLKKELSKLSKDIQSFDLTQHLSPSARKRVSEFEKAYNQVLAKINRAQRQFDRELNKALQQLKRTRVEAEKQVERVRKKAEQHKTKVQKTTTQVKKKKKVTKSGSVATQKRAARKKKTT